MLYSNNFTTYTTTEGKSFIRITEEHEIGVGCCYMFHEFCVLTAISLLNLPDYRVHQVSELHVKHISPFEFLALA